MQETIQIGIIALAIAGTISGISFEIYDSSLRFSAQQKELAAACIGGGGSWVPLGSVGKCLAHGFVADQQN